MKNALYLSKLVILTLLLSSCNLNEDAITNDFEIQTVHLDIHESGNIDFFIPITDTISGKLTISSPMLTKEYDITNHDNILSIPYGKYDGIIHGFQGFTIDTFKLTAPSTDLSAYYKTAIGRIPEFDYEITGYEIQNNTFVYLNIRCDTTQGYYTFYMWGTNDDDLSRENIVKANVKHETINSNGKAKLFLLDLNWDTLYKYYNVSITSLYGMRTDTVMTNWLKIVL